MRSMILAVLLLFAISMSAHGQVGGAQATPARTFSSSSQSSQPSPPSRTKTLDAPPSSDVPNVIIEILSGEVTAKTIGNFVPTETKKLNHVGRIGADLVELLNQEPSENRASAKKGLESSIDMLRSGLSESCKLLRLERSQVFLAADGTSNFLQVGSRVGRVQGSSRNAAGTTNSIMMENIGAIFMIAAIALPDERIGIAFDYEKSRFGPEEKGTIISEIADSVTRTPNIETETLRTRFTARSRQAFLISDRLTTEAEVATEQFMIAIPMILQP